MIVRIITDGCIGAAPGAVQLQVESSVTVQLQRAVVGVLSLPMALEQEPSPALARVATRASAVYAEACRELVVSHNTDAAEPGAVDSSTRGHNHEWRLMAAESGGYLGIGARPSFLFSVRRFSLCIQFNVWNCWLCRRQALGLVLEHGGIPCGRLLYMQ